MAENLRTRIERVEQSTVSDELAELRASLEGLAGRLDSLPTPSEEWRDSVAELASRVDALPAPSEEWREHIADLQTVFSDTATDGGGSEKLRQSLEALVQRVESLPAPSEEWRPEMEAIRRELETSAQAREAALDQLRSSLDALAGRIESLPAPSEDWRGAVSELASRIESLPAPSEEWRGAVAELSSRIEALPAPSEEWREQVADLTARVDSLPLDGWRAELAEVAENLRTRVERVEQGVDGRPRRRSLPSCGRPSSRWRARVESLPAPSEEWRGAVTELAGRIEALPVPSEDWREEIVDLAARVDSLPLDVWRPELAEVAENLRTRVERVEQGLRAAPAGEELADMRSSLESLSARVESLPVPSEEWHGAVSELASRIESLPVPSEGWREQFVDLSARVDSLPLDAWRPELAEVADNLRLRVERVEQAQQSTVATEELAQLRSSLDDVVARIASLPIPSEEWRDQVSHAAEGLGKRVERIEEGMIGQARAAAVTEIAEHVGELARKVAATDVFEARLQALGAQIDALPGAAESWREPLAHLASRIEELPVASEEWRQLIADLTGRIDGLRTDEWRPELAEVAENLRVRVEKIEREVASAQAQQLDGLRIDVAELTARIDAVPTSSDEIRAELAELAETLHGRVESVERRLASGVSRDALDSVVTRLDDLTARVADTSELEARLHESLSGLVDERANDSKADGADIRGRLDEALHRIAGLAGITERVHQVEERLETGTAELAPTLDELRENAARHGSRIEELAQKIRDVGNRRDAAEVEQQLAGRIDGTEAALSDLHAGLDALTPAVEERIVAVEMRSNVVAQQASADVDSLRRELDDLRAVVDAAADAGVARVDDLAESLRAELAGVTERFAGSDAVRELRSLVEQQGERLETVSGELGKFEHYADEKAAGQTAGLAALRARLETVETGLAEAGSLSQAVETLEARLIETSSSEAVERNAEVEALRLALSERVAALEGNQVKRKDLRELRDGLERVEQRVADRNDGDDAAKRAVEEAVREGLAGLGERLTATETTYLDAGKALRRSIEGLGQVISGADAHLAGVPAETAAREQVQATSYVAFAPTSEGYRLVACDGGTPALGGNVELPELEGVLTVTRVGASPLPFDTRPCVYLEHA